MNKIKVGDVYKFVKPTMDLSRIYMERIGLAPKPLDDYIFLGASSKKWVFNGLIVMDRFVEIIGFFNEKYVEYSIVGFHESRGSIIVFEKCIELGIFVRLTDVEKVAFQFGLI